MVCLYDLGLLESQRGNYAAGQAHLSIGERTYGLYILAMVARDWEDYAGAVTLVRECRSPENENEENIMGFDFALLLSNVAYLQQETAQAERFLSEAIKIQLASGQLGVLGESADALEAFACLSAAKGDMLRAARFLAESQKMQAKCAWVTWRWGPHEALRRTLLEQREEPGSRPLYKESEEMSLRQAFDLFLRIG